MDKLQRHVSCPEYRCRSKRVVRPLGKLSHLARARHRRHSDHRALPLHGHAKRDGESGDNGHYSLPRDGFFRDGLRNSELVGIAVGHGEHHWDQRRVLGPHPDAWLEPWRVRVHLPHCRRGSVGRLHTPPAACLQPLIQLDAGRPCSPCPCRDGHLRNKFCNNHSLGSLDVVLLLVLFFPPVRRLHLLGDIHIHHHVNHVFDPIVGGTWPPEVARGDQLLEVPEVRLFFGVSWLAAVILLCSFAPALRSCVEDRDFPLVSGVKDAYDYFAFQPC
mmetsp:Transcript_92009/g.231350  ORF Transcript_92009/g.231350 Transcript_92009/m.231350 type:complete len:274 (+) Transcript_92009:2893-3714(+)